MKKIILFSMTLIFGVSAQAQQAKLVYYAHNVPNAAAYKLVFTDLDPVKSTKITLPISNTIVGVPVLDSTIINLPPGITDTIVYDTLYPSIQRPDYHYNPDLLAVQSDSNGNNRDTLIVTTPLSTLVLTPPFVPVLITVDSQKAIADTLMVIMEVDPGFDTTTLEVFVDYANSLFKTPSWNYPAVVDTVTPIVGVLNQKQKRVYKIPLGRSGYPYSFVVKTSNSVSTDTTQIFNNNTSSNSAKKVDAHIDSIDVNTGKVFARVVCAAGEETSQLNVGIVEKQLPNNFLQSFALKKAKPGVNFYEINFTVPLTTGTEYTVTVWFANKDASVIVKEFVIKENFVYNPTASVITTEQQKDKIVAYPNPTTNVLYIRSSSNDVIGYKLYNSVGVAMREIVHVQGGQTALRVGGLPAGTYLLQPIGKTTKHSSLRIQIQ